MKKLYFYIFLSLILVSMGPGYCFADSGTKKSEPIYTVDTVIRNIELGTANADTFIRIIKKRNDLINRISHSAIANYMEALADEGMLKLIPTSYYSYDDIQTSFYVVFQNRENVTNNWNVFQNVWFQSLACR